MYSGYSPNTKRLLIVWHKKGGELCSPFREWIEYVPQSIKSTELKGLCMKFQRYLQVMLERLSLWVKRTHSCFNANLRLGFPPWTENLPKFFAVDFSLKNWANEGTPSGDVLNSHVVLIRIPIVICGYVWFGEIPKIHWQTSAVKSRTLRLVCVKGSTICGKTVCWICITAIRDIGLAWSLQIPWQSQSHKQLRQAFSCRKWKSILFYHEN